MFMQAKRTVLIKLALDILLALVFAALFNKNVLSGLAFHEIAGLAVGAAVILHKLLNKNWIIGITKKLFSPGLPVRTKITYFFDVLLLVSIAVTIVTGILMSEYVFAQLIQADKGMKGLHILAAYLSLLFLGVHIGLVWSKVKNILKKRLKLPKSKAAGAVAILLALAVFGAGAYNAAVTGYFSRITTMSESSSGQRRGHFSPELENNLTSTEGETLSRETDGTGRGAGKNGETAALLPVLYENLSVMAAFAVLIYYIDKLLCWRKKTPAESN
jgi:hypothetical protein